jgi:hypothetical protein
MWTQIVGKVRLALAPSMNQWWQVPLYLSARGLTTSPIPYGERTFDVSFDLLDHNLYIHASDGRRKAMPLVARPVADFYAEFLRLLGALDVDVHVWPVPCEVKDPIRFDEDFVHSSYEPAQATRFFRVLLQSDIVLKEVASRFDGKQSPVHFYWGSFDLAQTHFSGRPAPPRPGADRITQEAYNEEVMSFGFWPGTAGACDAAFYAYASPEPAGFKNRTLGVEGARYDPTLNEYLLPLEAVRASGTPHEAVLGFFQAVYEAGAALGNWDRARLDRIPLPTPAASAAAHPPVHPGGAAP